MTDPRAIIRRRITFSSLRNALGQRHDDAFYPEGEAMSALPKAERDRLMDETLAELVLDGMLTREGDDYTPTERMETEGLDLLTEAEREVILRARARMTMDATMQVHFDVHNPRHEADR